MRRGEQHAFPAVPIKITAEQARPGNSFDADRVALASPLLQSFRFFRILSRPAVCQLSFSSPSQPMATQPQRSLPHPGAPIDRRAAGVAGVLVRLGNAGRGAARLWAWVSRPGTSGNRSTGCSTSPFPSRRWCWSASGFTTTCGPRPPAGPSCSCVQGAGGHRADDRHVRDLREADGHAAAGARHRLPGGVPAVLVRDRITSALAATQQPPHGFHQGAGGHRRLRRRNGRTACRTRSRNHRRLENRRTLRSGTPAGGGSVRPAEEAVGGAGDLRRQGNGVRQGGAGGGSLRAAGRGSVDRRLVHPHADRPAGVRRGGQQADAGAALDAGIVVGTAVQGSVRPGGSARSSSCSPCRCGSSRRSASG